MNKTKAFFAGLGALMIAYFVIALAIFAYTLLVVTFSGVDPNGGFDMFLGIFELPWWISIPCALISFYSIGYFCSLRKNEKRVKHLEELIDNFFE